MLRFTVEFIMTQGWNDYIIYNQSEKISDYGFEQNIKLDNEHLAKTIELKEYIPMESQIYVSSKTLWGFVYLLNCKMPVLYYKYNEQKIKESYLRSDTYPDELFLLELQNEPFPLDISFPRVPQPRNLHEEGYGVTQRIV